MRNCRQGEQAVDVPRCSLQDIPASHAGPTKRPVRNVVGVNLGGGDSSGAGMVDLTEVGEDETPIETVRVGPVSSRTRRCPQDSSPSLASEGPAALSGETPVNLSSSGQPPARATVDSANRGAQRCVSRSEERSGGQYLEDSPSCGNDDELDTGTGDGEEIRDDIRADIRAGCAAGEASRSSLMHGTETPTAMQERRSSLGSVSNLTDKGNDELACEQVDAMDISMNVPTDDAVPGTLESSVVDGDAGGSGLCTETQVAEGVASGPSTGNGEGGGFEKERWVEVREPVVANRRKSRRVSDRARVDAGMDAEMDAMNKEQIPCMFMLDSTRGHRSQEVFKIVRKYVEAAWNDSRRDTLGQADVRPLTLPGCSPQVPQQSNDCDCGVYVIHYAKLFLKSAPTINRGVFHNSGRGVFSKKWFKESCIRQERRNIRNTVEALRWEALQQQRNGSSPC
ncbi:unnamed protein product [Sphacelaria rigidula]